MSGCDCCLVKSNVPNPPITVCGTTYSPFSSWQTYPHSIKHVSATQNGASITLSGPSTIRDARGVLAAGCWGGVLPYPIVDNLGGSHNRISVMFGVGSASNTNDGAMSVYAIANPNNVCANLNNNFNEPTLIQASQIGIGTLTKICLSAPPDGPTSGYAIVFSMTNFTRDRYASTNIKILFSE